MADGGKSVCFECLGNVLPEDVDQCHPNSVLRSGELLSFLIGVGPARNPHDRTESRCKIFGTVITDNEVFRRFISTWFNVARAKCARLECFMYNSETELPQVKSLDKFLAMRAEVCDFLRNLRLFLKTEIDKNSGNGEQNLLVSLIADNIKEFMFSFDVLPRLPSRLILSMASTARNQTKSIEHHYLHLQLDLRWLVLTILSDISPFDCNKITENHADLKSSEISDMENPVPVSYSSLLDEFISSILWDLIGVAAERFNKIDFSKSLRESPFPCTCVREFWLLMVHVLDERHTKDGNDPFWVTLHAFFQTILQEKMDTSFSSELHSMSSEVISKIKDGHRLDFCWWILLHSSRLYLVHHSGRSRPQNKVKSNFFEVCNFLRIFLTTEEPLCDERRLRCYLQYCLAACKIWETSMDIPILLWDYFYKRLNETFLAPGELTTVSAYGKSGRMWLKQIKDVMGDSPDLAGDLNSYQLFLRLLATQLRKGNLDGSNREWKQMKGRIFSKFYPRKMQELNVSGLHNCFCLFLTLASLADLEDVVPKVCDLLAVISPSLMEHGKHSIIWKAMFALMLICEERQKDLTLPAQYMVKEFSDLHKKSAENVADSPDHHMASELMHIYLEGLQDVFQFSSFLNLSEYILIASDFSEVLSQSSSSELHLALTAVQVILARQRLVYEKRCLVENSSGETAGGGEGRGKNPLLTDEHYDVLVEALWTHLFPLLDASAIGQVPHHLVVGVAIGYTLLAMDKPPVPSCPVKETFRSLLQRFGLSLQSSAEVACGYLANVMSKPCLLQRMAMEMPDYENQLVRAWFSLGIQLSPESAELSEFARGIVNLSEVKKVFQDAGQELPLFDSKNALVSFLRALDICYSKLPNQGGATLQVRQRLAFYTEDVMTVSNALLRNSKSPDTILNVYTVLGHIVRHIPRFIYISFNCCLLEEIISSLLLPPTVYDHRYAVPALVLAAVNPTLHLFIEGIASLGVRRQAYINRTLRDIFINYLPRFTLKDFKSPNDCFHPLVVSTLHAVQCLPGGSDVLFHAMEVVCDNFLIPKGQDTHLKMGFDFICQVLQRCPSHLYASLSPVLVPAFLRLLVDMDDVTMRNQICDLVKTLIEARRSAEDENRWSFFMPVLQEIIKLYFGSHSEGVFKVLKVVYDISQEDMKPLVPLLAQEIYAIEEKGAGQDDVLRSQYQQFLSQINAIH